MTGSGGLGDIRACGSGGSYRKGELGAGRFEGVTVWISTECLLSLHVFLLQTVEYMFTHNIIM